MYDGFTSLPLTSFSVLSDTTIIGNMPGHTAGGSYGIGVVCATGVNSNLLLNSYTYNKPSFSKAVVLPIGGNTAGTAVDVFGQYFTGATSCATIGGVNLTSFVIVDDTHITGTTGAHAAGLVSVSVTNPFDSGSAANHYCYFSTGGGTKFLSSSNSGGFDGSNT